MTTSVTLKEFRIEDIPLSCTWIMVGPPGSGKCLAPGTPVIMADGTTRAVENVKAGEMLMGDDSKPRRVLTTCSGEDEMYQISQNKGEDYVVNGPHILCLKRNYMPRVSHKRSEQRFKVFWMLNNIEKSRSFSYVSSSLEEQKENADEFLNSLKEGTDFTRENILEISVEDYLQLPKTKREKYKGYRTGVDFPEQDVPMNPQLLGLWLGDGHSATSRITTADKEIVDYVRDVVKEKDLFFDKVGTTEYTYSITTRQKGAAKGEFSVSKRRSERNAFLNFLREYGLLNNKHIPDIYKYNSREKRLQLLAGIIDSDGHLANGSYYEIVQKSTTLTNDIAYLARSLGYYVSVTSCSKTCTNAAGGPKSGNYYRINICSRALHEVPVLLPRKKFTPETCRTTDETVTGITVKAVGRGTYHGFQIDGNRRFLLGDFTVTHNTTLMNNLAYYHKHRYPVARAFIGTDKGYAEACDTYHPLFVSNYYDEGEEKSHIVRQRTCELENGEGYPGNYAINIIDDASDDPKVYKTKVMRGLFKLGSQHWNQLAMVGSQYAIDMPPDIRKSVSYVAIFREPEEVERKKLYTNFGGMAGSYANFCDLMDQITGDYTCLIFKKRSQSNDMEDNIFWYKTKPLDKWKFGCKEYRQWGKDRYDPNYIEQIII